MTIVEVMEGLKDVLEEAVKNHETDQPSGKQFGSSSGPVPIAVYAGFPPVRTSSKEQASFVYALVTDFEDADEDEKMGTATVEIGFSIYESDTKDGWRSLFNLMEHVRQALLAHRYINNKRCRLTLPLKGAIASEQPFLSGRERSWRYIPLHSRRRK